MLMDVLLTRCSSKFEKLFHGCCMLSSLIAADLTRSSNPCRRCHWLTVPGRKNTSCVETCCQLGIYLDQEQGSKTTVSYLICLNTSASWRYLPAAVKHHRTGTSSIWILSKLPRTQPQRQPTTNNQPPTTNNQQPTNNKQQTISSTYRPSLLSAPGCTTTRPSLSQRHSAWRWMFSCSTCCSRRALARR